MKRSLLFLLLLTFVSFFPKRLAAGVKLTCIDSRSCTYPCYSIAWIEYTDPDGNTTGSFGSCCSCA